MTGSIMEAHDIHCHHKRPAAKGGTDEYGNLVLISAPVHKLIHASDMATIKFYLNLLNLGSTQILKLNKFREMAEMSLIDLKSFLVQATKCVSCIASPVQLNSMERRVR